MQAATARAWSATDCSAVATPLHASCTAASHTSLTSCCAIWLTENGGGAPGAAAVLFLADGSENGGGSSETPVCQKRKGPCVMCEGARGDQGARGDRAGAGANRCGVVDGGELIVVLVGRPAARRGPPRKEAALHAHCSRRDDNDLSGD